MPFLDLTVDVVHLGLLLGGRGGVKAAELVLALIGEDGVGEVGVRRGGHLVFFDIGERRVGQIREKAEVGGACIGDLKRNVGLA